MRFAHVVLMLGLVAVSFDARSEGRPRTTSARGGCSVLADSSWTRQEIFVWERVCSGAIADFNAGTEYDGPRDPKEPEGLPASRVLTSRFLETILLKDKYRNALTRSGVRIVGARFRERLYLANAEIGHEVWLDSSQLDLGANLAGLRSTNQIALDGSKVTGTLDLNRLRVDSNLFMRKMVLISPNSDTPAVQLVDAHISHSLDLSGSQVTGTLDFNRLRVDLDLSMSKMVLISPSSDSPAVQLIDAHIGHSLDLSGSQVTGMLNMNGIRVDIDVLMRGPARFGKVDLVSARVAQMVELTGANVAGKLDMNNLQARGLLMNDSAEFDMVILTAARIGVQLALRDSKVVGALECPAMEVGQDALLDGQAEFNGPIDCQFAVIKGNLQLRGGTFHHKVDLTGAQIGRTLMLKRNGSAARWLDGSALTLRNAHADTIAATTDPWPAKLNLDGFTYRAVEGGRTGLADAERWLAGLERYLPQPYEHLATAVQNQGDSDLARAIRYAGRERERGESAGLRRALLTTLDLTIGYGYHIERAMIWAALLVVTGAIVLRISGEGPKNGMPIGLAYSFDVLLPVIKLRDAHYNIDLAGWSRYYFYAHKIAGFLLASFLVAGVSGLTK